MLQIALTLRSYREISLRLLARVSHSANFLQTRSCASAMRSLPTLHRAGWSEVGRQRLVHTRQSRIAWRGGRREGRGESSQELFEIEPVERWWGGCRGNVVIS